MLTISKNNITNLYYTIKTMILSVFYFLIFCVMLKIPKVYVLYHIYLIRSKYAIRDSGEVIMLNAKKIKKRYYIFLVFYLLTVPAVFFMFDNMVSPDLRGTLCGA